MHRFTGKSRLVVVTHIEAEGVGIFIKKKKKKPMERIKYREIIPGRIFLVDCFYHSMKIRIINLYTE